MESFPRALDTPWCGDDLDQMENFPFFNNTATIDFPFIAASVPPTVNPPEANDYIDVKSLVIPNCFQPSAEAERKADVEFVREYKRRRSRAKSGEKEERPPPRRNPKRQARVHAKPTPTSDSEKEATLRRTTRTSVTTTYGDRWPVDGMHEKPHFNPVTGRLEKLPSVRRRARREDVEDDDDAREFAALAHGSLHYALLYVDNVKKRNAIASVGDRCANVAQARDLLVNACTLYCVAHDVAEESLAKYLDTVAAGEDIGAHLRGGLDAH